MEEDVLDSLQQPLPNAQAAFILGILSIFPGCICYCLGPVLGIIGLIMGYNALQQYDANPGSYSEHDYKQAKNGKNLSIVGILLGVAMFILGIVLNIGTMVLGNNF